LAGVAVSGLFDQRQQVIDSISELVPLRAIPRPHGRIALLSVGGLQLVDGPAAVFGFESTPTIVPEMTQSSGALSGLTINGRVLTENNSGMDGGRIAANFAIRDDLSVAFQAQLDSFSRDLIERFQDPSVDPTLAVGDAGLFTDNGSAFDSINEVGLASRLSINSNVDPAKGGALHRLRDGVGASAAGNSGDSSLYNALYSAMTTPKSAGSTAISTQSLSAQNLTSAFLSTLSQERYVHENEQAFARTKSEGLVALEKAGGVDTDLEMQKLLLIEQAYGANARVIQTVDDLIQTLIRI